MSRIDALPEDLARRIYAQAGGWALAQIVAALDRIEVHKECPLSRIVPRGEQGFKLQNLVEVNPVYKRVLAHYGRDTVMVHTTAEKLRVTTCIAFERYKGNIFPMRYGRVYITDTPVHLNLFCLHTVFDIIHELSDKLLSFGNIFADKQDDFKCIKRDGTGLRLGSVNGHRHPIGLFDYVHVIGTRLNELSMSSTILDQCEAVNNGTSRDYRLHRCRERAKQGVLRQANRPIDFVRLDGVCEFRRWYDQESF